MIIAAVLILAGMLSSKDSIALDPEWEPVVTASTGAVYYMRKHLGEFKTETHPRLWIIGDYSNDASVKYHSDKLLVEFQCDKNTYQPLETIRYSANGAVLSVERSEPEDHVAPKTVVAEWYGEACMPYFIYEATHFTDDKTAAEHAPESLSK